jgi:hypothetical protein
MSWLEPVTTVELGCWMALVLVELEEPVVLI